MKEHDKGEEIPLLISTKKIDSGKWIARTILIAGILLLVFILYSILNLFISPDRKIQQIYLVPEDAAFIIQSSRPVDDWQQFSQSEECQMLKKVALLDNVVRRAESLDSLIHSNKKILSLIGERDMLISVHKTRARDWDYLIILDMQKVSKMDLLKDQIELILRMTDFTVTQRIYKDIQIVEMRNPETRDILYAAFVENHFVASYTPRLVESAIDARLAPSIGLDYSFIEAEKQISGKGLYRVFINYSVLPQFMTIFLDGNNEYLNQFSHSMDYAGLYFQLSKSYMEMRGYTFGKEDADPYVEAFLRSGKHKMTAHSIMSARTALYSHFGLNNLSTFVKELEKVLSTDDPTLYQSYMESKNKIEKLFDISLEEHFLSWMSGEFALSQSEAGMLGKEPEYILVISTKSIKEAQKKMDYVEKKIKSKTPVKISSVEYKGYEVNYIEMKGFFRLFFGKLFDRFEKPYYTYIDDYVVFSNQVTSLLSFIEDYTQKNLLKDNPGFKKAMDAAESQSTLFLYADIPSFFPHLQPVMNSSTWAAMQKDREILYSFPHWMVQIVGNDQFATLQCRAAYEPYIPAASPETDPDKEDKEMNEDAESEKEILNELKRFYIEEFQGHVLRNYYDDGALRSETEIKEGKRHGRHREYYPDGKLKVRGKYVNNVPKGTWKYYSKDGKFERKEKK